MERRGIDFIILPSVGKGTDNSLKEEVLEEVGCVHNDENQQSWQVNR